MDSLKNTIIRHIAQNGPISFKDFMEMALYFPDLGYYASTDEKIGANGDYFTSPALSPLFGEMLAGQITEMWESLGRKKFTIVEYGAGTGSLCRDILENFKKNELLYSSLDYYIIEKSASLKRKQQLMLSEKVKWLDNIHQLSDISGCILSNELIDNFAVHAVVMEDDLMEVFVGYKNDFYEILKPADSTLKNYFEDQQIKLPKDFRTEVNLQAIQWLNEISKSLKEGFVLTMDYGCTSSELYDSNKKCGSLLCYHQHQINDDPFINIGKQDITAHVNFSALKFWGIKNDLHCCGYTTQSRFLRSLGILNKLREMESAHSENDKITRLKTLVFGLGEKIKCMVQKKGLEKVFLTGLQFQLPI